MKYCIMVPDLELNSKSLLKATDSVKGIIHVLNTSKPSTVSTPCMGWGGPANLEGEMWGEAY